MSKIYNVEIHDYEEILAEDEDDAIRKAKYIFTGKMEESSRIFVEEKE